MPQPDPLNNIMTTLRRERAIDPATAQARQARMTVDRRRLGAAPGAQATERPPAEAAAQGQVQVANQDMLPIIVDQMNETIISYKIQLHRERDPEIKRSLERQIETLRQNIVQLGGEPIYADESVEEGLQKLRGMGAVGAPQVNAELGEEIPGLGGVPITAQGDQLGATLQGIGASKIPTRASGIAIRPYAEQYGAEVLWSETDPLNVIIKGPQGQAPVALAEEFEGRGYAPEATLKQALLTTGVDLMPKVGAPIRVGGQVIQFPTAPTTGNYNEALKAFAAVGLSPDQLPTLEDWEQFKVGSVQKAALGKRQVIQRELDRFQANYPNEFEKAKKDVAEWAGQMKAGEEESKAAKGMYYSSMLANALGAIDKRSQETINEIARDAANKVADLRAQMQDVDELAVLETEIAKREARMEYTEQRANLAAMLSEIQYKRDTVALDQFRTTMGTYMDVYNAETTRVQQEYDRMIQAQGWAATGLWAKNDPFVRSHLESAGIMDQFDTLAPAAQAALVDSLVNIFIPMKQNEEKHRADLSLMAAQTAAEYRRAEQIDLEIEIKKMEKEYTTKTNELLNKYLTGTATPEEEQRLRGLGALANVDPMKNLLDFGNFFSVLDNYRNPKTGELDTTGKTLFAMAIPVLRNMATSPEYLEALKTSIDEITGVAGQMESILAEYGQPQPGVLDRIKAWFSKMRKQSFYSVINDPKLSQEAKREYVTRGLRATPAEIMTWGKERTAEYKAKSKEQGDIIPSLIEGMKK